MLSKSQAKGEFETLFAVNKQNEKLFVKYTITPLLWRLSITS